MSLSDWLVFAMVELLFLGIGVVLLVFTRQFWELFKRFMKKDTWLFGSGPDFRLLPERVRTAYARMLGAVIIVNAIFFLLLVLLLQK